MSLAQMSLMRALVVRFWKQPYRHALVPWGTQLHDRFMLPELNWADFRSVIEDFNLAGYPFRAEWFAPFFEFRFPVFGRAAYDGVQLELRMALEPWLVLGEEATAQRQARVVDSALERLQVKCRGLDLDRHLVTCNGRPLPMQPTGEPGVFVAAVRYKAWQAVFGLHPTIGAHAPARVRRLRSAARAVDRRVRVSRESPWRPQLREVPRQCVRGGVSPHLAVLGMGTHRRRGGASTVGEGAPRLLRKSARTTDA